MIKCEIGSTNLQKMQRKTLTNTLWYGECLCLVHYKHLYWWRRITQTICIPSKIQKISQWNRCSTYLRSWYPNNQTRSMEWVQLIWKIFDGSIYIFGWWWTSHQSLAHKRSTYSQILYYVLERWTRTQCQIMHGKTDWSGSKVHQNTELWTINGEPLEFEWNIFPGFTTLQLVCEVQEFLLKLSIQPEDFTGRIIFMSMFNDISWGSKDNEKECE